MPQTDNEIALSTDEMTGIQALERIKKLELKAKLLDFIEYFNKTMAKPFKSTYRGKPLEA